jgi:hypothetical protein
MPKIRCQVQKPYALTLLVAVGIGLAPIGRAFANDPLPTAAASAGRNAVSSDRLLELGTQTPEALRLEGEQSMRNGNYDKAISLLKKSVELSPSDMDGRLLCAEAMEKKLLKQQDKDPVLFNALVKQWYVVAKKANFLDQQMQGRSHLTMLTGSAPGRFDTEKRFLSRVLIPEDGSVKVALSNKMTNKNLASTGKDEVR